MWILFVREKVAAESTRQSRPASTPKPVNQTENSIGYRRILLEYQVQGLSTSNETGGSSNTRRIRYLWQILFLLQPSPRVANDREIVSSSRIFFYLSSYHSFFVSQTKYNAWADVCASRSLARDREAVVRENQANHAGGPFSRGEGKATRSNGNSLKRRGLWTLVVDRYRTPIFPNPISRNVINIIFLKTFLVKSCSREIFIERERRREGRGPDTWCRAKIQK